MPNAVVPLEAVLASTDPVAMDRVGAEIVDDFRKRNNLSTLEARGDSPRYIDHAGALGLGISSKDSIDLKVVAV